MERLDTGGCQIEGCGEFVRDRIGRCIDLVRADAQISGLQHVTVELAGEVAQGRITPLAHRGDDGGDGGIDLGRCVTRLLQQRFERACEAGVGGV